ncbi:unnamed protein product, partial [Effrenium voratum]
VASIRDGRFGRAEAERQLKQLRRGSSLQDLTSAAKRAGDQGLWQQVLQLLEDAGEMQLAPDMILYGAVMSACEKNHQWQQALGIFHQLRKPSLVATSIAISALGRGSLWASALQLQMELPQPNVITYNATISACERGQQWSVALALLDRMPTRKVSPDIISFNAAINACEKAEEWQRALQAFDAMTIEANEITYNTVMSACHKGSHWHLALTLFNSMSSRQLAPTPVSHSAAMAACLRGDAWQRALGLYMRLPAESNNAVLRGLGMDALLCARAWQSALSLLQPERHDTDRQCFNAALRAGEFASHWRGCLQLLEMSPILTASEVTIAMQSCAHASEWQTALCLVFETMPALGIEADALCLDTAVDILTEAGHAEGLEMMKARTACGRRTPGTQPRSRGPRVTRPPPPQKARPPELIAEPRPAEPREGDEDEATSSSYRLLANGEALIDLHGLPVEVSKIAVQVALEDLVLGAPGSTPKAELRDFIIVTGVGNNSPGGIALIRPAVIAFLREDLDIAVLETRHDGPGRLRVPAHELRTRTAHGEGEGGGWGCERQ